MKRITLFVLTLLLLSSMAQAATYYVATTGNNSNPGTQAQPFQTIQKGIDAAANGDTVLVGDGWWAGAGNFNLDYKGKNFTLKSLGGAARCIIDCQKQGRGFLFHSNETAAAVLEGFTIQNAEAKNGFFCGGGINVGNNADTPLPASPTIRNCILLNNYAYASGGGIGVYAGQPVMINCVITGSNSTTGGVITVYSSRITMLNCTVANNATLLDVSGNANLTLTNCIFWGNGYGRNDARYTVAYT